jgi:hypothetical protein
MGRHHHIARADADRARRPCRVRTRSYPGAHSRRLQAEADDPSAAGSTVAVYSGKETLTDIALQLQRQPQHDFDVSSAA